MGMTIAQKILKAHLVDGEMVQGQEIGLRIDQTLTQDATGTMAYLQFEAMGVDQVRTERSVAYIDHNTLQSGFENADDHKYIGSVAKKHGIYYSKAGNGICHQVHLERFGAPGKTLIGSDSHTPTGGGIGMLAFGAGGLDVAVAMGGGAYYIPMPKMVRVNLTGKLSPWVSAKDVILEVLRQMTVKGGVGKIVEYAGEGVKTLSVPERATITNMGAELGATTSIFPSDEETKKFLEAQGRGDVWTPLSSDPDAVYDEEYTVDLSALEPLAAMPHMPDNVKKVTEIGPIKVNQCCIGSCTNSSYYDMMKVASILKGKTVHPDVSLTISPGSKQVFNMLAENGALADIIAAGARILECACGPCIGMGQSPESGGVSLRTFNRNFEGRSGTQDAQIYLVSPELLHANVAALADCDFMMPYFELTDRKRFVQHAAKYFCGKYPQLKKRQIAEAADAAYQAQADYYAAVRAEGQKAIAYADTHGLDIAVIAGRPYHVDPEINHGIDQLIASFGLVIVSEDAVWQLAEAPEVHVLNQWTYHSRMYGAAKYVTKKENAQLIQLVSFGCGIDAITTDEVRAICENGGKIYTQLKIDEISNLGAAKIRIRSMLAAVEEGRKLAEQQPNDSEYAG